MAKAAGGLCALLLLLLAVLCCQSRAQRALAVPDKCCFNFHMRRIKRDNIVACYPTSPECPHKAVIPQHLQRLLLQGHVHLAEDPCQPHQELSGDTFPLLPHGCACGDAEWEEVLHGPGLFPAAPRPEAANPHLRVKLLSP
ncbi:uncharacterized protein PRD47_015782 isoform 1-T1 [Ara ararauna]